MGGPGNRRKWVDRKPSHKEGAERNNRENWVIWPYFGQKIKNHPNYQTGKILKVHPFLSR